MDLLQALLSFVIVLGVLITVHEYGHYWVARRLGVKILKFSIGFGRTILRRKFGETEFVIAMLPLGGYVKMLDESEGDVSRYELDRAFNRKPLGIRTAVVAAGPLANLILAFLAYWVVSVVGVSGPRPIIGEAVEGSIAAQAGLVRGYEIISVEGNSTPTWDAVYRESLDAILDGYVLDIVIRDPAAQERSSVLDVSGLSIDDVRESDFLSALGITPLRPVVPPVLKSVLPGKPADLAGFRAGDRVRSADGQKIENWHQWVHIVRLNPERSLNVLVERAGDEIHLVVIPMAREVNGRLIGHIGAEVSLPESFAPIPFGTERYTPIEAALVAVERTWVMSVATVKFVFKLVSGELSVSNLGGPITIAHYAGESAKMGLARFLEFLAVISISLAILNLMPIPLLDGGHLLYYLVEFVIRRPVADHIQAYGRQIGFAMLLGLMGLAIYNDVLRIL